MIKKILFSAIAVLVPSVVSAFGFEHKATHVLENSVDVSNGIHDVVSSGDYLYVVTGKEYAPDVLVVDISDPVAPVSAAKWTSADLGGVLSSQEVIVHENYMYMTGGHELVVYDISDITSPRLIDRIFQVGLGNGTGIVSDEILYIRANAGYSGLYIFDVSDPSMPTFMSVLSDDENTLLTGFGDFVTVRGDYLFVTEAGAAGSSDPEGMQVVDVSDPLNPITVRTYEGEKYSFRRFDPSKFGSSEMVVTTERQKFAEATFYEDGTMDVTEGVSQLYYYLDHLVQTDEYVVVGYDTNGGGLGLYNRVGTGQVVNTLGHLSPSVLSDEIPSIAAVKELLHFGDYVFAVIDGSIDNSGTHQIEVFSTRDHVYRFWSDNFQAHFYTSSFFEQKEVRRSDPNWKYEGTSYEVANPNESATAPTYRFWSPTYQNHFYTSSIAERDQIMSTDANWLYEGEAFFVRKTYASGFVPVYRFYSRNFDGHFYTPSEAEKNHLEINNPNWQYEGIAWYAQQ